MTKKKAIIIFVKYPQLGKVKTRLASDTNNSFALGFYNIVARYLFAEVEKLNEGIDKYIFYSGIESADKLITWVDKDFHFFPQTGSGLGEKISNAFKKLYDLDYEKVLITGSDIPDITSSIIESSFDSLSNNNVVIAPSDDGGYSLLGTDKYYPGLFRDIEWSTNSVFDQTKQLAESGKLKLSLLPVLNDIDTKADLQNWLNNKKDSVLTEQIKFLAEKENIEI